MRMGPLWLHGSEVKDLTLRQLLRDRSNGCKYCMVSHKNNAIQYIDKECYLNIKSDMIFLITEYKLFLFNVTIWA